MYSRFAHFHMWGGKSVLGLILPAQKIIDYHTHIKIARLCASVAVAGCFAQCTSMFATWSIGIQLTIYTITYGLILMLEMGLIIITKGTKWQYATILVFLSSALYIGYLFNEQTAASITSVVRIETDRIELRSSSDALDIPLGSISCIELRQELPGIAYRSNGLSMKGINMGYFVLDDDRKCFLFLVSKSSPFIYIERSDDIPVFINRLTPKETVELHQQLLSSIESKGK